MPKPSDLQPGDSFGRWTVIRKAKRRGHSPYVLCKCSCGIEREVASYSIRTGASTQCKKCSMTAVIAVHTTHGDYGSREYRAWIAMLQRKKRSPYYLYVSVSDEWKGVDGFSNFLAHMGRKPSPAHELDRIDNLGNYEPGNVRWATRKQQMRNTSYNVLITFDGRTQCMAAWAEELGVLYRVMQRRMSQGWTQREVLYGRERPIRLARSRGRKESP